MDFAEIYKDATRQNVSATLHYSATNQQVSSNITIDATQWHNYAVAWTPTGITAYIDGVPYFHTSDTSILPPGPMHLCIQLDAVGTKLTGGAQMQVAWANQYTLAAITSSV